MRVGVIAVVLGLSLAATPSTSRGCDATATWTGGCSTTDGSTLTISGTKEQPGSEPPSLPPRSQDDTDAPVAPPPLSRRAVELAECLDEFGTTRCADLMPPEGPPPPPGPPGLPAVTISDLARFAPAPIVATTEPGDVAIAGMPANFVSAASVQTASGAFFGVPIAVRFTPVAYDYTYGDGTTATSDAPGRTWAELGQAQFTATPTTHVYAERGTYRADVDVRYVAEVDLGGGWFRVAGELRTDGPPRDIRVFTARTALVGRTCEENPGAPGC